MSTSASPSSSSSSSSDRDGNTPFRPTILTTSFTVTRWVTLALASGAFAAFNGLFAKLTTTEATGSAAAAIAHALHLQEGTVEVIVRAICFGLNLLSNFIMWALFTRALTAAPSTTKVSITNTSANFLVTAVLGMIVFGERVNALWWLGAVMMGAGCILVGMRDEKDGDTQRQQHQGQDEDGLSLNEGNGEGFGDTGVGRPYHDEVEEER